MKVGIVGASGYAGVELLRLCAGHPDLEVAVATAGGNRGQAVATHTPSLAAAYPTLVFAPPMPASWTVSTWCSWPCPTASPSTWCPR